MSAKEQWNDLYAIAEEMFRTGKPKKHSSLDLFEQIVCARYDTVFKYDPYLEEYSFRNQELNYDSPVRPKIRPIAEIDLEALKTNTMMFNLEPPTYMELTPLFGVAPSTLLVFANSQPRVFGLTQALENVASKLTNRPHETDIRPGADFLYRHRDSRLFRVIILKELDDVFTTDAERRYEVAFLDVCQVIALKLKHLFMPLPELSLEKFPCAVFCARFRGISVMRSGYLTAWNDDIKKIYTEKHKSGVLAIVYKMDSAEQKIIVDFPSFIKMECTESDYLKTVHGHLSLANKDPLSYTIQDILARVVHPLKYESSDEIEEDENNEIELDLDSSDASGLPAVENSECPLGMASIESFFKQTVPQTVVIPSEKPAEVPTQRAEMFGNQRPLLAPKPANPDVSVNLDISVSIPSDHSENTTPLPTFDIPERGDRTPTKQVVKNTGGSLDGWGDDTPRKSPKKQIARKNSIDEDGWGTPEKAVTTSSANQNLVDEVNSFGDDKKVEKPVPLMSLDLEVPMIERATSPVPVIEMAPVRNGSPIQSNCQFVEKETPIIRSDPEFSSPEPALYGSASSQVQEEDDYASPYGSPGKLETTVIEQSTFSQHDVPKSPKLSPIPVEMKNERLISAPAAESSETDDDVFKTAEEEEIRSTPIQDVSIGNTTSRLMSEAQANFHDYSDNDDLEPSVEVKDEQVARADFQKMAGAFRSAFTDIEKQKNEFLVRNEEADDVVTSTDSVKSLCQTDDQELEEDRNRVVPASPLVDEFTDVPETLKTLSGNFLDSIQIAAAQKNRHSYNTDIFVMESIALKSSGNLEQSFWKSRIQLAKSLEPAFD